jgi:hypothetical protein
VSRSELRAACGEAARRIIQSALSLSPPRRGLTPAAKTPLYVRARPPKATEACHFSRAGGFPHRPPVCSMYSVRQRVSEPCSPPNGPSYHLLRTAVQDHCRPFTTKGPAAVRWLVVAAGWWGLIVDRPHQDLHQARHPQTHTHQFTSLRISVNALGPVPGVGVMAKGLRG